MKKTERAVATVTIKDAAKMTARGRKRIATWLRSRAVLLEKHGDLLAGRFTARYFYQ